MEAEADPARRRSRAQATTQPHAPDPAALFVMLDGMRRMAPRELDDQLTNLIREFLLTLRSLIDWYLERLDRPPPGAQDGGHPDRLNDGHAGRRPARSNWSRYAEIRAAPTWALGTLPLPAPLPGSGRRTAAWTYGGFAAGVVEDHLQRRRTCFGLQRATLWNSPRSRRRS